MHLTSITTAQKELLPKFRHFSKFTLVGGTALALQLGHRISVDFDWFTNTGKQLPRGLYQEVKKVFASHASAPLVKNNQELTLKISGIKTTFLHYPFKFAKRPLLWRGLHILSVPDIAVMKAYVFGRRLAFKDYVDLYFIFKRKVVSLDWIIKNCQEVYQGEFHARLFLEQILNPEDIEQGRIDFLKGGVSRGQIKKFFERLVKSVKI